MSKSRSLVLAAAILIAFGPSPLAAQTYDTGLGIGVYLFTECVEEYPAPRNRAKIGIGEQVKFEIPKEYFVDEDWLVGPYGTTPVLDEPGSVTWYTNGLGMVNPAIGWSTTYTAPTDITEDTDAKIEAVVEDAALFADDPPIVVEKKMEMVPPTSFVAISVTDKPGSWPPGKDRFGARSLFLMRVFPVDVNFSGTRLAFLQDKKTVEWNDKTKEEFSGGQDIFVPKTFGETHNLCEAMPDTGLRPVARLAGKDQTLTFYANQFYEIAPNTWQPFNTPPFRMDWEFKGATSETRIVFPGMAGGWMGPWQ